MIPLGQLSQGIEILCRQEFFKQGELYNPSDILTVKVVDNLGLRAACSYISSRYHEQNPLDWKDPDHATDTQAQWTFADGGGFIIHMNIHHKHRRKGYGDQMIKAIESVMKQCGVWDVSIYSVSEPYRKFFFERGYEIDKDNENLLVHRF